jgi:hypothetical protein
MGGGRWTSDVYSSKVRSKAESGTPTFAYSSSMSSKPRHEWKVSERLDPKRTNKKGDHAGLSVREACKSEEHPNPTVIEVFFDVTGSMGEIPVTLQTKLPQLLGMLQRRGVPDPQILFGAIGDAKSDRAPLQVGQFESDNRMDDDLEELLLEGGGGGGCHESYELAMLFLSRCVYSQAFEEDGRKSVAFIIGDERAYSTVRKSEADGIIGPSAALQGDTPTSEILEELRRTHEVFFIFAKHGQGRWGYTESSTIDPPDDGNAVGWRKLMGGDDHIIVLEQPEAVCEAIAGVLAVLDGASVQQISDELLQLGSGEDDVATASKALVNVGALATGAATRI